MNDVTEEAQNRSGLDTFCLGTVQRHRLLQSTRRYCKTVLWDGIAAATAPAAAVVVMHVATALLRP